MSSFQFKHFTIQQSNSALKVGTDAMLLGAFVREENPSQILDIGCGTGVLSLMLAQNHPEARITGIDIDEASLIDCKLNFDEAIFPTSFEVIQGDVLEVEFNGAFDLVVSNPPFYQSTLENQDKRMANAKHAQSLPSDLLVSRIADLLTEAGSAWIIVPAVDDQKWIKLALNKGLVLNQRIVVFNKIEGKHTRSILQFSKTKRAFTESRLHIRNQDGSYSEEYIQQTKEFHSKDLSRK